MKMGRDREIRRRSGSSRVASDDAEKNNRFENPVVANKNKPIKVTGGVLIFITVIMVAYFKYKMYLKNIVITPLDSPKMNADNSTSAAVNPDRFWGTYRSNLYFGMKTRSPRPPVFGFMWLAHTNQMPPPLRHWCDQGDGIPKYGWLKHDGINFGIQEIEEKTYSLKTSFVKREGGKHGGDWSARISVQPKNPSEHVLISLFFYAALDGQGSLEPSLAKKRLASISGQSEELGNFKLSFPKSTSANKGKYDHLISYVHRLDRITDVTKNSLRVEMWDKQRTVPYFSLGGRLVPRESPGGPNFMVHQVTVQPPYEMEVVFESGSFNERPNTLSGEELSKTLNEFTERFDKKFTDTFGLENKGFSKTDIDIAKAVVSNMLGGIGYFYGSSIVQSKYNKEPVEYWPAPLFTAVPSRSFFPRGFLWDEGFHNLLISQWSPEISKDIISHWLDLINTEGWIPREQILGHEARARVPAEFVIQRNENANPPTLFLPLKRLVQDMVHSSDPKDKEFLKSLFPRLKAWYNWYNISQVGAHPLTYRWRGRDDKTEKELNPKTLTSGLDDYPRASHPTSEERHIDLRCWIALASGILSDIAKSLGENWKEYESTYKVLTDNNLLNQLHWSPQKQRYCDYGLNTNKMMLKRPKPPPEMMKNLQPGQPLPHMDKVRVIMKEPTYQFVDSFGYVSLFPFLLKIVDPDSPKLMKILSDLKNPDLLWTDYGLRSLARNAPLYNRYNTEHDPPYWRGAIWVNMNYLVLSALHHYSETSQYKGPAKSIYTELRNNLIKNIIHEYKRTGYIWEQYDDKTGHGKGSHPFTGWSALVVMMMAEKY